MTYKVKIRENDQLTKVLQIVNIMTMDIDRGFLKKKSPVPSINQFSKTNKVARETVEKAYDLLRKQGYLVTVAGKGSYVADVPDSCIKVLMVLNKISSYKKEVYDAFRKRIALTAKVDIKIYDYNPKTFCEIIDDNINKYHYYVVMPHFYTGTDESPVINTLRKISSDRIVVLDRDLVPDIGAGIVFQNFEDDIYGAFYDNVTLFKNYQRICIIFPSTSHHPKGIVDGVSKFCKELSMDFRVVQDIDEIKLQTGEVFITVTDSDLAILIKKLKLGGMRPGKDVGVISFNETVLKELLEITVVTTDFEQMGQTAAEMIMENKFSRVRNPFKFIKRRSI